MLLLYKMGSGSSYSLNAIPLQANDAYYELRAHPEAHYSINSVADFFGKKVGSVNGLMDNYNSLPSGRSRSADVPIPAAPQAPVV